MIFELDLREVGICLLEWDIPADII